MSSFSTIFFLLTFHFLSHSMSFIFFFFSQGFNVLFRYRFIRTLHGLFLFSAVLAFFFLQLKLFSSLKNLFGLYFKSSARRTVTKPCDLITERNSVKVNDKKQIIISNSLVDLSRLRKRKYHHIAKISPYYIAIMC